MKLLNFTIIKLTSCLVLGILIAHYFAIPLTLSLYATLLLLFILGVVYFMTKQKVLKTFWFGLFSFLSMISIGVLTTNGHNESQDPLNYTHIASAEQQITFRIRTALKSGSYHDKYIVDILKIDSLCASGKALLNVSIESTAPTLKVDNVLITSAAFQDINSNLNPHQFNYKDYLEKQYIYKQLYVKPHQLLFVREQPHTIYGYADAIREAINSKLEQTNFSPDVLSIINALILGQRQQLSKDIYENYKNAGAVHIPAVSGYMWESSC
ncbi:DUF4131 domain-containing protein [Lacinutrix neustonica]|uniref:DUF4131 domain-containing protein n=1 Tax=Lacinutrix neustonica TaxID=2980107 RepID=A0A9E8SCW3_9FLAO|nr:DUF4131 domain-containing protein [Lacinutrix neustonica]WAC01431.1 DUF4131 domain-containing protein [Lacinutrix neustonica]